MLADSDFKTCPDSRDIYKRDADKAPAADLGQQLDEFDGYTNAEKNFSVGYF
jgi:hypothetical protein